MPLLRSSDAESFVILTTSSVVGKSSDVRNCVTLISSIALSETMVLILRTKVVWEYSSLLVRYFLLLLRLIHWLPFRLWVLIQLVAMCLLVSHDFWLMKARSRLLCLRIYRRESIRSSSGTWLMVLVSILFFSMLLVPGVLNRLKVLDMLFWVSRNYAVLHCGLATYLNLARMLHCFEKDGIDAQYIELEYLRSLMKKDKRPI